MASGGRDCDVKVWDVESGICSSQWSNTPDAISNLAFTPDGHRILTGGIQGTLLEDVRDKSIKVWDAKDGTLVKELSGHCDFLMGLAISGDGTLVVSGGGDYHVRVWNLSIDAADLRRPGEMLWVSTLDPSVDGRRAVSASDDAKVRIWDLESRKCLVQWTGDGPQIASEATLSKDGRIVASAWEDGRVRIWDATDGKLLHDLSGHLEPVNTIGLTRDGSIAVSGAGAAMSDAEYLGTERDHSIRVWRLDTGAAVRVLKGHTDLVSRVVVSPDNSLIVSSSWDERIGVWDLASGTLSKWIPNPGKCPRGVSFTPDGRTLVTCDSAGVVRSISLRTGETHCTFRGHVADVRRPSVSADGLLLATASDDESIRNLQSSNGFPLDRGLLRRMGHHGVLPRSLPSLPCRIQRRYVRGGRTDRRTPSRNSDRHRTRFDTG